MSRCSVVEAAELLRQNRMVILIDDENRENEGDLICAAENITAEHVNFMITHARGLLCLSLDGETCDRLNLPMMVTENRSVHGTGFTVTIEAAEGITTGISAADRAHTIKLAADKNSTADTFVRPGHIQPLRAKDGGVLVRTGQTEGSVDLMKIARMRPAAVIIEIMNADGTMSRLPDLEVFSKQHNIPILSVAEIIAYRNQNERLIEYQSSANLPTRYGDFQIHAYFDKISKETHVAITHGDLQPGRAAIDNPVLVRVHSECLTGDAFGSTRCDCGDQLHTAMRRITEVSYGVVLYLRNHEGRGIGLANKIRAYNLQDQGYDTVDANLKLGFPVDMRDYGIGAQILADLGIRKMQLLTNNNLKLVGLSGHNLEIIERIPFEMQATCDNINYLTAKRDRMGHLMTVATIKDDGSVVEISSKRANRLKNSDKSENNHCTCQTDNGNPDKISDDKK